MNRIITLACACLLTLGMNAQGIVPFVKVNGNVYASDCVTLTADGVIVKVDDNTYTYPLEHGGKRVDISTHMGIDIGKATMSDYKKVSKMGEKELFVTGRLEGADPGEPFDGKNLGFTTCTFCNADLTNTVYFQFFYKASNIKKINWGNVQLPRADFFVSTFYECGVDSIDISGLGITSIYLLSNAFSSCPNLKYVNASGLNLTGMDNGLINIFSFCPNLKYIDISGWNVPEDKGSSYLFYNSPNIEVVRVAGCTEHTIEVIAQALRDVSLNPDAILVYE